MGRLLSKLISLSLTLLAGINYIGTAYALSGWIPGAGVSPGPAILTFILIILGVTTAYLVLDKISRDKVCSMKENYDINGLISALDNEFTARRAAIALGELADERAVEPLINALSNKNDDVRQVAAESLGKIGDIRAIEPLKQAENDEYKSVRDSARSALEYIMHRHSAQC